jgi:hypothetical protein
MASEIQCNQELKKEGVLRVRRRQIAEQARSRTSG